MRHLRILVMLIVMLLGVLAGPALAMGRFDAHGGIPPVPEIDGGLVRDALTLAVLGVLILCERARR